jgi:hypothetical protein
MTKTIAHEEGVPSLSEKMAKQHRPAGEKQKDREHKPEASGPVTQAQSTIIQMQQSAGNRAVLQRMQESAVPEAAAPGASAGGNRTGLPDGLKTGVESLSGMSLDDVKVHYNSSKPKSLDALAYAQGSDIHVGPGQEKHLPHEAWHVVQQKQGRVSPTMQLKQFGINDSPSLEKEADRMGDKAASYSGASAESVIDAASPSSAPVQLFDGMNKDNEDRLKQSRVDSKEPKMQLDHAVSQDSMKTLASTMGDIQKMIDHPDTKYTRTKAAYEDFEEATGDSAALKKTLLNLTNNITPGYQLTTGNPGSGFDPQIKMVGNKSMPTTASENLLVLDTEIRKLYRLPLLNQNEALHSEDEGLDTAFSESIATITACITEVMKGSAPTFDAKTWYTFEDKNVKRVPAEWLDSPVKVSETAKYPALQDVDFTFNYEVPVFKKDSVKGKKRNEGPTVTITREDKQLEVNATIPVSCWEHIYDRHFMPTFVGDVQAINTFWKQNPVDAITEELLDPEIELLIDRKRGEIDQVPDDGYEEINVNEYVDSLFFQGVITVDNGTISLEFKSIAPQDSGLGYAVEPQLIQSKSKEEQEELRQKRRDNQ